MYVSVSLVHRHPYIFLFTQEKVIRRVILILVNLLLCALTFSGGGVVDQYLHDLLWCMAKCRLRLD